ncbi:MAG: hypothetical protein AAGD96_15685 [Chloroflexota bacterium]
MDINSLEERIEKPGYLLLVVTTLLLLIIGWVNLISVQSETPVLFNWFSIPQFAFIILYTIFTIRFGWLLRWPNDDAWFTKLIINLQNRPMVGLIALGAGALLIASLFIPTRLMDIWLFHPALQVTFILVFILFLVIMVMYRNQDPSRPRIWKLLGYGVIGFLAIELILQGASLLGLSPLTTALTEAVGPYDRIYYINEEGSVNNTFANEFGWHFPEFRLEEDSHRIAVLGDAYVKGYGVSAEDNLGVKLDILVNEEGSLNLENPEAFSLGFPDYDTGLFLSDTTVQHNHESYEFDDLLIFFDLADDFQTVTAPSDEAFFYYEEDGELILDPASWGFRHDAAHFTLWGSADGFKPNRFLNSQIMLSRLLQRFIAPNSTAPKVPAPQQDISLPNSFVFYEETDDNAQFIVDKQLEKLVEETLTPYQINSLLVTIPAFPKEFYAQSGTNWTTQFGEADLQLPESVLRETVSNHGVSFLGMIEYMKAKGLSVDEVQALFMADGLGYFTPEGHAFFAQAAFECFYAQSIDESSGCYLIE